MRLSSVKSVSSCHFEHSLFVFLSVVTLHLSLALGMVALLLFEFCTSCDRQVPML